jgi:hypothetical protein
MMTCYNCGRDRGDVYLDVRFYNGRSKLVAQICGHCWVTVFMAPHIVNRLRQISLTEPGESHARGAPGKPRSDAHDPRNR